MSTSRQLEALAARCLVLGFDGLEPPDEARRLIELGAGGVILFRRNVRTGSQVRALTDEIRALAPGPVLLSVDQEGGRVARLQGIATDLPSMRQLSRHGEAAAESAGGLMARELTSLGFDLTFAPVADVDTYSENPIIGDRSFSADPHEVARLAVAFVRGLQTAGLAGCAKHFPGHGDTRTDSHLELPSLPHDRTRLDQIELVPFAALSGARVATMMTAHISLDGVDPGRPATMSPKVLGILRHDLEYDGVVFTDDMEMQAITDNYDVGEAAVAAVCAGCDQVIVCHRADRQLHVVEALARAMMDDRLRRERVEEAAGRLNELARRFDPRRRRQEPNEVLRTRESLSFAEDLRGNEEPIE